jgi:predicted MPP superfamily phosphohydrolase
MLLFFSLLSIDIIKLFLYIYSKINVPKDIVVDSSRRQFIINFLTLGVSAGVLVASGISVFNYLSKPIVTKIKFSLNSLPKIFNGYRIVQISDLHVGQLMTKSKLKEIVELVNELNPDLIAITGDLVDGSLELLSKEITPIKDLKAKDGVYFVTGNHEYYNGVEEWVKEIKSLGVNVLNNENTKILNGSDSFYLVGINDFDAKRFGEKFAPNLSKALSGINNNENVVLLAHQPLAVKEAAEFGVDLVLSGHTHGGQIWPFNYLVSLQQKFLKGFYQYKNTKLYVNQGTGCWGPPMRLGSENEITEITLESKLI